MSMTFKLAAAALMAALAGCGGDTYVQVQGTTTVSKGQELTDLQRARAEGAISQQEYDEIYKRLLARPN